MRVFAFSLVTVLTSLPVTGALAQEASSAATDDQLTRQLWDDAFIKTRPHAPKAAPKTIRVKPTGSPPAVSKETFLGVTLWVRPPEAPPEGGDGWTAHRAELDSALSEGQRVRLGIEASRSGYLYVIDREENADGSLGEPYLIFPTLRIRAGDNVVRVGRLIEIPDSGDRPPHFTMKRSHGDQVGERLTLLVTPTPLSEIEIGRNPKVLPNARVKEWESKWSAPTRRLELAGGPGRPYTNAEKEAGQTRARLLTQEDPLPQTMFRVETDVTAPVLVTVPLRLKP